jgi:hypothetical protein
MQSLLRYIILRIKLYCLKLGYLIFRYWPGMYNFFNVENLIRSIPEVAYLSKIACHIVELDQIRTTDIEHYKFPNKLPSWYRKEMSFSERHIYSLKDVIVSPKSGACCTNEFGFLESYGSLRKWLYHKPITRLKPKLTIEDEVTCLNHTGFAHFLMEEVPRLLWILKEKPSIKLIQYKNPPKYILDIYKILHEKNILRSETMMLHDESIYAKRYTFTQAEAYSGFWHSNDIMLLRDAFLERPSKLAELKLYISRKGTQRSFENEQKIEDVLSKRGFQIVTLENYSFKDQVALFQHAAVIVAPHGAGLANIVWCNPGTKVVELFSYKLFNDCFARLCSQVSCKYYCCWAIGDHEWGSIDTDEIIILLT